MGIIPASIKAGLTFITQPIVSAHPAPDWALSALLRGPQSIDIDALVDGSTHYFRVDAAETAAWTPGNYWYSVRATGPDGIVVEVESGEVAIKPDLAAIQPGHDGRDHVRRTLEAIEAVLEKRATLDQERYKINNRELWRTPVADLLKLRDRYKAELRMIKAAAKGTLFNQRVKVGFTRV